MFNLPNKMTPSTKVIVDSRQAITIMVVKPNSYYDLGMQGAYCRSVDACLGNTDNITVHAASFSLCGLLVCRELELNQRMVDFQSTAINQLGDPGI